MAGRDRISADNSTLVVSPCLLSGSSVRGLFEMVSLSFCTAAKRTKLELNCSCISTFIGEEFMYSGNAMSWMLSLLIV